MREATLIKIFIFLKERMGDFVLTAIYYGLGIAVTIFALLGLIMFISMFFEYTHKLVVLAAVYIVLLLYFLTGLKGAFFNEIYRIVAGKDGASLSEMLLFSLTRGHKFFLLTLSKLLFFGLALLPVVGLFQYFPDLQSNTIVLTLAAMYGLGIYGLIAYLLTFAYPAVIVHNLRFYKALFKSTRLAAIKPLEVLKAFFVYSVGKILSLLPLVNLLTAPFIYPLAVTYIIIKYVQLSHL